MHILANATQYSIGFRAIKLLVWSIIIVLPILIWLENSAVLHDLRYGAAFSQLLYALSKLTALYAIIALWLQLVITLNKTTSLKSFLPVRLYQSHRVLGWLAFGLTSLHITLFVTAVSIRKQTLTINLLGLDFSDYYHTGISIGAIAFWSMLIGVASIAASYYWLKSRVRNLVLLHRLVILAVILAFVHSYMIGTETRQGFYLYYYHFLFATISLSLVLRFKSSVLRFKE